jgi:hypothetical protein
MGPLRYAKRASFLSAFRQRYLRIIDMCREQIPTK